MKKVLSLCVMCLLTLSAMSQKTVWVDLDLPSGTKWKSVNESGFYSYEEAIENFGKFIPTKEQWLELRACCVWEWQEDGYRVTGNNGNSIFLPAEGLYNYNRVIINRGMLGNYWSSTSYDSDDAWQLEFDNVFHPGEVIIRYCDRPLGLSVRLVQ